MRLTNPGTMLFSGSACLIESRRSLSWVPLPVRSYESRQTANAGAEVSSLRDDVIPGVEWYGVTYELSDFSVFTSSVDKQHVTSVSRTDDQGKPFHGLYGNESVCRILHHSVQGTHLFAGIIYI